MNEGWQSGTMELALKGWQWAVLDISHLGVCGLVGPAGHFLVSSALVEGAPPQSSDR